MLDAIPITLQPYNSSNSLANQVGIAIWNNVLYNKVGTLWKITSTNVNYNPCSVDSAYDVTDYNNLRCVDNYEIKTSITENSYLHHTFYNKLNGIYTFTWEQKIVCTSQITICTNENITYTVGSQINNSAETIKYRINKIENKTEYKAFSSF